MTGLCVQHGAATITFFDRTFDEAFDLLIEARAYLSERQRPSQDELPPAVRLVAGCETMRLTARLVQVMAWLLVQRAVHAGEIDAAEADAPQRRLGGHEVCAEPGPWDIHARPRGLQTVPPPPPALNTGGPRLAYRPKTPPPPARAREAAAGADSAPNGAG